MYDADSAESLAHIPRNGKFKFFDAKYPRTRWKEHYLLQVMIDYAGLWVARKLNYKISPSLLILSSEKAFVIKTF